MWRFLQEGNHTPQLTTPHRNNGALSFGVGLLQQAKHPVTLSGRHTLSCLDITLACASTHPKYPLQHGRLAVCTTEELGALVPSASLQATPFRQRWPLSRASCMSHWRWNHFPGRHMPRAPTVAPQLSDRELSRAIKAISAACVRGDEGGSSTCVQQAVRTGYRHVIFTHKCPRSACCQALAAAAAQQIVVRPPNSDNSLLLSHVSIIVVVLLLTSLQAAASSCQTVGRIWLCVRHHSLVDPRLKLVMS